MAAVHLALYQVATCKAWPCVITVLANEHVQCRAAMLVEAGGGRACSTRVL